MFEIVTLAQIVLVAVLVAAPAVAIARALDTVDVPEPVRAARAPWPRGVQEEEPTRWLLPVPTAPTSAA